MKVSVVSINAKYVHTGLAGRYLVQESQKMEEALVVQREFSINQPIEMIVSELMRDKSDAYGFSTYIWNMGEVLQIIRRMKKIRPEVILFLGGPEVSYEEDVLMRKEPSIDFVVRGEGEGPFKALIAAGFSPKHYGQIPSLSYRLGQEIICNPLGQPTPMESLPVGYTEEDFSVPGKIFYYESSRGCPYRCAFCLSAQDGNRVRVRPLDQVKRHMKWFLDHHVKQVKFIDRTFNADIERALELIDFLEANHNGITNFHFECSPDRLTDEFIDRLARLPEGMIQFEIGIQSTNPETSRAIHRPREIEHYRKVIGQLREPENIHLHVDLIAGLPFEDYASFSNSFNDVFSLKAHVIQLGFLKLLKGSELRMRNLEYGLTCCDDPPYEVLKTPWLSYEDVQRLKWIEDMVDKYYNSQGFISSLPFAMTHFKSPFDFFEKLSEFWVENDLHLRKHRKGDLYQYLQNFSEGWTWKEHELDEWEERLLFDSLYATGEAYRKDHEATKMKRSEKNKMVEGFLKDRLPTDSGKRKKQMPDVSIARFVNLGHLFKQDDSRGLTLVFHKKRVPLFVEPCRIYQLKEEENHVQFKRLDLCL